MNFQPTPNQKLAIDNRGALLVSAAAGSGKTAVLVERVVQCVLDRENPVDIDRMLVVTFTNAAAGEMKERIRLRLAEEYAKTPENLRLLQQQILLEKASISTIDSFCKTLITQHFDQLGISPDFKLLSGNNLALIKKEAMEETLNFFFETQKEDFSKLAKTVGADHGTKNLEEAMETVYSYIRSLPFPALWTDRVRSYYRHFTTVEASPWGGVIFERAKRILTRSITQLKEVMDSLAEDPVVAQKRGERLGVCLLQMKDALAAVESGDWDKAAAMCRRIDKISFQGANLPKGYESNGKTATAAAQKMSGTVAETLKGLFYMTASECEDQCRQLVPMIDLLLDGVWEYSRRIDQKKKDSNSLDFSDVEYAALALLVRLDGQTPVLTDYAEKIFEEYEYVMVDEYQDVNDLQSEIFRAITCGGQNLFTVGDVKQSIYRFRKANPRNFLRLLQEYPAYDGNCSPGKLVLDGNFRSRPAICDGVNSLFSLIMSEYVGEITYDQTHCLKAMGSFPPSDNPSVELDFLSAGDERTTVQLEADRIAYHIRTAMATPCVASKGELRPARYGDCVILLRGLKNRAEFYVKRLREHGIPAVAEQAEGFFERQEIARILCVLRAIDNPTDDVALLACMMSPLFGFTADQVAAVRGQKKKTSLYLSLEQAAGKGDQKAVRLVETLQSLRVYAATVSAADLLNRIYHEYGYLVAVQVMENGAQCRQNLLTLKELAQECSDNGYDRLDGFVRYTEKLQQEEVAIAPKSAVTTGDAVRIMSIHHSKGLQFPVCIIAGCGNPFNRSDAAAPVLLDETLGLGLTLTDDARRMRTATCMRLAVAAQNRRAEMSEELRILYVAMTRGVDKLILLSTFKNGVKRIEDGMAALAGGLYEGRLDPELVLSADCYGQLLLYFALLHPAGGCLRVYGTTDTGLLSGEGDGLRVSFLETAQVTPPEKQEERPLSFPVDEALYRQICQQLSYRDPYAPLQGLFSKRSVSQLVHDTAPLGNGAVPRPSFLQAGGLSAAEKGTALHQFMQYADYQRAAADPAGEIRRLTEQRFITKRQADAISLRKLERFFGSSLYRRMAASAKVMREHRFMSRVPVTQLDSALPPEFADETIVIQGITDCVFHEQGGLVVVDYKTDRVSTPEELAGRYDRQLRLYAAMLQDTYGLPVRELILYSFHLDREIKLP